MLIIVVLLYLKPESTIPWSRTLGLGLFLFAALTDWLDGWMARKFGQVSEFGKFMDALCDKVLTLGMFTSLLAFGLLPLWSLFLILLILSRELLITGLRLVAAGKGKNLAAEKVGKLKTVVQLLCITLALCQIALKDDLAVLLSEKTVRTLYENLQIWTNLTLVIATLVTVVSGVIYLMKYWRFFLDEEN